jgi:hypothetical protein
MHASARADPEVGTIVKSEHQTLTLPTRGVEAGDWRELVAILREKDRHIRELEAECRGLAEQLVAFQAEIVKWGELDQ